MKILKAARFRGFTLVELAVTLVIVTLVLGSILVPLVTQVERRQISDTQKALDEIKEALLGYAVANGYLPCPDNIAPPAILANDGVEDRQAGGCMSALGGIAIGNVPWVTLGLGNTDAWGNRFRYVVNELYARNTFGAFVPFSLSTAGTDVKICTTAGPTCVAAPNTPVVAAIISHGKNGYGAMNSQTNVLNPLPPPGDELENTNADAFVISRVQTSLGAPAGEFDDIVTSLPRFLLFSRMVAAGKLP